MNQKVKKKMDKREGYREGYSILMYFLGFIFTVSRFSCLDSSETSTGKNRSKPYDGLLMVFCWHLKPELLTNHHMVFMKSDGFLLVFY